MIWPRGVLSRQGSSLSGVESFVIAGRFCNSCRYSGTCFWIMFLFFLLLGRIGFLAQDPQTLTGYLAEADGWANRPALQRVPKKLFRIQGPPPPFLATGPPALGAIGRWQPDQTKTRIRRASAHVASTHVRATSLVSSGPQLPLPPAVRLEPAHHFPSSPHQVLPLISSANPRNRG